MTKYALVVEDIYPWVSTLVPALKELGYHVVLALDVADRDTTGQRVSQIFEGDPQVTVLDSVKAIGAREGAKEKFYQLMVTEFFADQYKTSESIVITDGDLSGFFSLEWDNIKVKDVAIERGFRCPILFMTGSHYTLEEALECGFDGFVKKDSYDPVFLPEGKTAKDIWQEAITTAKAAAAKKIMSVLGIEQATGGMTPGSQG